MRTNNYSYSLNDAVFLDDSTLIVVGDEGVIMKSNDLGTKWRKINSGTNSSLRKMQFLNSKTGYILEKYDFLLRTDDGGENWFRIPLNNPGLYLMNLYFLSPDTGFVVGGGGGIFKTVDGGRKWDYKKYGSDILSSVTFLNDTIGFTCGAYNTLLKTIDLGKTWKTINMSSFGSNLTFVDVVFTNGNHGYLLGRGGEIIVTSDTGSTWNKITTVSTDYTTNIYFVDDNVGYVIGGWSVSTLYKTTNGGANWHEVTYSHEGSFSGIALNKSGQKGIVVGNAAGYGSGSASGHVILKSEDAGENWSTISCLNGKTDFYDVSFIDDSIGYVFGGWYQSIGFGYKTTNTGLTWERSLYSAKNITECQFIKRDIGFLRSDSIYFTEDGGNSLETVPGIAGPSMEAGDKMFFFNADTGIYSISGDLLRTTDRGKNWKKVYDGNSWLTDIEFRDSLGFAVGYNTVIRSIDAGKTWTAIDTFSTTYMRTVFLLNADTIFIGGTNGLLYYSNDSGLSWNNVNSGIPIDIVDLYFYDDSVGIAIANNNGGLSEIYHSYNYGLSWTRTRQVGNSVYKYSDVSNGKGFFVGDKGLLMKIDLMTAPTFPGYIVGDTLVAKGSTYTYNLLGHDGEIIKWGAISGNILNMSGDSIKISWPDTGNYSITVSLSNDCGLSPTREFKVHVVDSIVSSINSIYIKDGIKIFPNPSNGQFAIEVNSPLNKSLNIFDLNGHLLLSKIVNKKSVIDLSNCDNGVYILSIEDSSGIAVKKLVVVR